MRFVIEYGEDKSFEGILVHQDESFIFLKNKNSKVLKVWHKSLINKMFRVDSSKKLVPLKLRNP